MPSKHSSVAHSTAQHWRLTTHVQHGLTRHSLDFNPQVDLQTAVCLSGILQQRATDLDGVLGIKHGNRRRLLAVNRQAEDSLANQPEVTASGLTEAECGELLAREAAMAHQLEATLAAQEVQPHPKGVACSNLLSPCSRHCTDDKLPHAMPQSSACSSSAMS